MIRALRPIHAWRPIRAWRPIHAWRPARARHPASSPGPLPTGRYPEGVGELMPGGPGAVEADLEVIAEPLDRYGVHYRAPTRVGVPAGAETAFGGVRLPAVLPFSVRGIEAGPGRTSARPVVPEGLTELPTCLRDRYGERLPPVVITENGCSYEGLDDRDRIAYLDGHVRALHAALEAGVA